MGDTEPIKIIGRSSSRVEFSPQPSFARKEETYVVQSPQPARTSQGIVHQSIATSSSVIVVRESQASLRSTSSGPQVVRHSSPLPLDTHSAVVQQTAVSEARASHWIRFDEQSLSNIAGLIIKDFDKNRSGSLEDSEIIDLLVAGRDSKTTRISGLEREEISTALLVHDSDKDGK